MIRRRLLALIASLAAVIPVAAEARPPTVSNWAGYNRRLEESRQALQAPSAAAPAPTRRSKTSHHRKSGGADGRH